MSTPEQILCVDASVEPAQAVVVRVDGTRLTVVKRAQLSLDAVFAELRSNGAIIRSGSDAQNGNGTAPKSEPPREKWAHGLKTEWTNAILLVPPQDFLALSIELPFGDPQKVNRVVDLEVQDNVPFEVDEFLLQHSTMGQLADNQFDVYVSMLPRETIREMLSASNHLGFDPLVVSVPTACAAALFSLAPHFFAKNSAVLIARDPYFYLAVAFDGVVRIERALLLRRNSAPSGIPSPTERHALVLNLRLSIAAAEQRYGSQIEALYLVEEEAQGGQYVPAFGSQEIQQTIGRKVVPVRLRDFVEAPDSRQALLGLSAIYGCDERETRPPTNFRTREFSFRPPLTVLLAGLRSLMPTVLLALTVLALVLAGVYLSRQFAINDLRDHVRGQIREILPEVEMADGLELDTLKSEAARLEIQLKDFGTTARMSPLDVMHQITQDFPSSEGVTLQYVSIQGSTVKIEGSAPDYSKLERIERAFQRRKSVYCRVRSTTPSIGAVPNSRTFSYEMTICE